MATPLIPQQQHLDGGGGVAVLTTLVPPSSSNGGGGFNRSSLTESPILIFSFFQKAIGNELDALHRLALDFATGNCFDIGPLSERYHFLRSMYRHHSNAEDEVIFPALDRRVKNVAQTYSLEHKGESNLFDHLFELLNSSGDNDESFRRELASCTGALQTSVSQHMAKEQQQVFPLLIEKFSVEEQASLVWQFLCSIPVNMMAEFLPWLSTSISPDESQDLRKCLSKIVPEEKLLQKVIFTWMEGRSSAKTVENCVDHSQVQCSPSPLAHQNGKATCACESTVCGKRKYSASLLEVPDTMGSHPIDEILLWHNAIKKELNEIAAETRKIQHSGDYTNLSAFNERLQFIAEVFIFHSIAEDKVIFPAVDGDFSFFQEHAEEESQFNDFRSLIERIVSEEATSSSEVELYSMLCSQADHIMETIQKHFHNEEVQVLPLARKHFSLQRQRELVYESLCMMPLKLIERVLPWFVGSLTEDEAEIFLKNIQSAAPAMDSALVTLFSGWACKARKNGRCLSSSASRFCPAKKIVRSSCACASALSGKDCSVLAESDGTQRSVKRSILELQKNGDVSKTPENEPALKPCCGGRSCCVPALGVNSNNLGLSSLSAAKSLRNFTSSAPSINSSLFIWETDSSSCDVGSAERPIDTIFKFHKAIRIDLEYLDVESGKLCDGDEATIRQFTGRFRLLWGLYRAHSNAEDDIVFPALESKLCCRNPFSLSNTTNPKMVKRSKKSKSKRVPLKKKYKILKKVKEHNKKKTKEAKKLQLSGKKKVEKDPGIPNDWPFKEQELKLLEARRERALAELAKKKDERKERARKRKAGLPVDDDNSNSVETASIENTESVPTVAKTNKDSSDRAFAGDLEAVIATSDVILEVLDARDPLGTRCVNIEKRVRDSGTYKRHVLLLNKIDLVPRESVEKWLKYLREEFPTVAFKCSTQQQKSNLGRSKKIKTSNTLQLSDCLGAETLLKLLKNYARSDKLKTSITVGLVGLPNVGKSSLINSLMRSHAVHVSASAGSTRSKQEIRLDKNVKLLDCPGVVMLDSRENDATIALKNCKRIEKLADPVSPVKEILKLCPARVLISLYKIPSFDSVDDFLQIVATVRGKLKKGGIVDIDAAARIVLHDWNIGKIPYYTMPPVRDQGEPSEAKIVSQFSKEFNIDEVYNSETSFIGNLKPTVELDHVEVPSSCPLIFDETMLEDDKPVELAKQDEGPENVDDNDEDESMECGKEDVSKEKVKSASSKQNEKLYTAEGILNPKLRRAEKKKKKKANKASSSDPMDGDYDFKVDYFKKDTMDADGSDGGDDNDVDDEQVNTEAPMSGVEVDA